MKQSLQLRIGQQLAMTPQLQQAIRLLQLSTLELQAEVQEALDSNLMLEVEDEIEVRPPAETSSVESESTSEVEPVDIPQELPVDSVWEDIYDSTTQSAGPAEPLPGVEAHRSAESSLYEHLMEQINLLRLSEQDRAIATAIADAIDADGYLRQSTQELSESLVEQGVEVEEDEVHAVLSLIQNLDPGGVGARDLGECLAIQLRQMDEDVPWRNEALELVSRHIDLLGSRDFAQLTRLLGIERDDLKDVMALIQTLTPRPGQLIETEPPEYVVPDVFVFKKDGVWQVELNADAVPKLRVNANYASLIRRADSSSDNVTLKSHLQEARWFIKSLRSRSETLLKVATCIVERQQAFLEHGDEGMKPMVLHDIAEAVQMHESTISRVTTNKYMHTPRGIYELKYFFSSHVFTKNGAECSSTAIRALLKKLIDAENPRKPLSDSKLSDILSEQGITVARRTVAKYREAMSIPSSTDRKALV
ncbi:MAG: RNA polymerase factor sigma-54 [Gammaproteobacteria bacterium]|nr:RNA polymerase factor sigma-54 [Gammaproteobacteria bacterium]